jgi:D-alanyl-D-alanine carboxypeptidase
VTRHATPGIIDVMTRRHATRALAALALAAAALGGAAASPSRTLAAEPLPACTTADDPAPFRDYPKWRSTFVDTQFRVTKGYVPPNLVSTADAGTNGGYRVRRLVIDDHGALVRAARRAGVTLRVESAYRSFAHQRDLFEYYVELLGPEKGALRAARPGHSEHQLGTTLDISNTRGAYDWLARRAWRFGFVISYPPGERATSCYRNEPWHIRYVGRDRAARIHESGLVPREWLWINVVSPSLQPVAGRAV